MLTSIHGTPVPLPDPDRLLHLQFRRFAGCPVCNLHLRSVAARHDEIRAAGIREVVVFHSTREELLEHAGDLPFDVVADPDKHLYRQYGVGSAPRALLDPRAWPGIVRAIAAGLRHRDRTPSLRVHGGRLGLPGDFLIAPDGRTIASKYGEHADDQWSVDDLLALVPAKENRP
ncbi:MAG TPA: peroxiredoxin-like family protein [Actinophytocola sp.]|nr:peroxiredoxin-like family protein [Actinophytocola sp.]